MIISIIISTSNSPSSKMKALRSIFVVSDEYAIPSSVLNNDHPSINDFNRITRIVSNGHPVNCEYFSFRQVTQGDLLLSTVNASISPTFEIVQLLAWQLDYRIRW